MENTAESIKTNTNKLPFIKRSLLLKQQNPALAKKIQEEFAVSNLTARVLAARGFSDSTQIKNYLEPSLREGLPDPKGLLGIEDACNLISEIVHADQAIAICCDFDVDGLSGGAQAHDFFNQISAKSKVFVPNRFEDGYGLNSDMVREISHGGFKLLLAIDFGTTNSTELALASSLGLKTIVVDHHHVKEAPKCDVFINPCQNGCGFAEKRLSAAGLVWYLILALRNRFAARKNIDARDYLEFAALGTICDMVPLLGANRVIAKRGLEKLTQTKRPGLSALRSIIGLKGQMRCHDVSFGIGPRINAAGRINDASTVIELLTTQDSFEANKIARRLNALNLERQETENYVKDKALELLTQFDHFPDGIVIWDPDFHTGVVGIVAQRLAEKFHRPAVVLGIDKNDCFKGSVRSVKGISVVELLTSLSGFLEKFGGHDGAGGLTIQHSNLEAFRIAFDKACRQRIEEINYKPVLEADTLTSIAEISPDVVAEIQSLAPFGMGNPQPQLMYQNLTVKDFKVLKNSHLKLVLSDGRSSISALWWRNADFPGLKIGSKINLIAKPEYSTFTGLQELQLVIAALEIVN